MSVNSVTYICSYFKYKIAASQPEKERIYIYKHIYVYIKTYLYIYIYCHIKENIERDDFPRCIIFYLSLLNYYQQVITYACFFFICLYFLCVFILCLVYLQ